MRSLGRALVAIAALALAPAARAQQALLQGGPWTGNHAPMYFGPSGDFGQPILGDSGPASGGGPGVGLSELGLTVQGTGTPPYANAGTGPYGANLCDYDAPITNATGYHYFCFSPNAQGGGLIAYGAAGTATALPLQMELNGVLYQFPFTLSGIVGPNTTAVGDVAMWNNTTGTLLKDSPVTGSGSVVLAVSPNLTTPNLGTPSALTLTNGTGLPVSTGLSGLGTGIATALGVNIGSAGAPVLFNGAGGTPSLITLTNGVSLPVSTGISGLGTGVATLLGGAATGTGGPVGSASPTLTGSEQVLASITAALTTDGFGILSQQNSITSQNIYEWAIGPGSNPAPAYDALRGVAQVTAGSTILTATGAAGYVINDQAISASQPAGVALFGVGISDVTGASTWGIDVILSDNRGQVATTNTGRDVFNEADCNLTSASSFCEVFQFGGYDLSGGGTFLGPTALALGGGSHWTYAFGSANGASAATFAFIGAVGTSGTNINSQGLDFHHFDATGAAVTTVAASDDFLIVSNSAGAGHGGISLLDGVFAAPTGGGLQVNFNTVVAADSGANAFFGSGSSFTNVDVGNGTALVAVSGPVQTPNLPTSAGGGGLNVCIDTSGNLYKKASCP